MIEKSIFLKEGIMELFILKHIGIPISEFFKAEFLINIINSRLDKIEKEMNEDSGNSE